MRFLQTMGDPISRVSDPNVVGQTIYGPHAITLVAKEKGVIVGIIHGIASIPPNIVLLLAKPVPGLGSTLVDKFVEQVRVRLPSARSVRTNLPADVPEIVGFYSSKGFIVEGFVKEGIQGRDLVFLQKALTQPKAGHI